jgi:hypothetical protein
MLVLIANDTGSLRTGTTQTMDWKDRLENLFSAAVNQGTLEEAADLMVNVSARHLSYHDECMDALGEGIRAADAGDPVVIRIINTSGYQVDSTSEAGEMLRDFLRVYLEAYDKAMAAQLVGKPTH